MSSETRGRTRGGGYRAKESVDPTKITIPKGGTAVTPPDLPYRCESCGCKISSGYHEPTCATRQPTKDESPPSSGAPTPTESSASPKQGSQVSALLAHVSDAKAQAAKAKPARCKGECQDSAGEKVKDCDVCGPHTPVHGSSAETLALTAVQPVQPDKYESCPDWVIEAEKLYLSKRLSSYAAVGAHFGKTKSTVSTYAVKRDWSERKRKIENDAALELRRRIEEGATQDQVDTFATITQNAVNAGLRASVFVSQYMVQVLTEQKLASAGSKDAQGKIIAPYVYVPPTLPKVMMELMQAALDLRPQEQRSSTALDRLGELLNPRPD